ncbi:MAG: RNA-binding S4 domain-containing protein [Sulfurimonas sp.]
MVEFALMDEYIELYKLIKLLDLVDSGAEAKRIVAEGFVLRNGDLETRKRAKIVKGDIIEIGEEIAIKVV